MKIAANLSMLFTELPLRQRVQAAAAAGFDGVEIQFPYELPAISLKDALERAGLPLVLINVPAGDLMTGGGTGWRSGAPGRLRCRAAGGPDLRHHGAPGLCQRAAGAPGRRRDA